MGDHVMGSCCRLLAPLGKVTTHLGMKGAAGMFSTDCWKWGPTNLLRNISMFILG